MSDLIRYSYNKLTVAYSAKYPLAHISRIMDTFGKDVMVGYDIGCGFSSTANRSTKLGERVRRTGL